ncbi:hypothetical protein SORBI_3008G105600 [Sorghum bicolor]|uniref:Uncharacterized protein n=1 Tax=Sorghum bicolor TaxID=4558 RepID=A0A1B6PCU7_SORBI|nr:hypothetical protein SORBI_3008G105600 [Sorghum bicolor]
MAPAMEEIPVLADPAAMSRRGSSEGWPNTGKVHSGFTSLRSSKTTLLSSYSQADTIKRYHHVTCLRERKCMVLWKTVDSAFSCGEKWALMEEDISI